MTHKPKRHDQEGPIHKAILQYLRLKFPDAVIHHSPNEVDLGGKAVARAIAKARNLGTMKGWPDIEMLWCGQFWTFEVKAPRNYATEAQKAAGKRIVDAGGRWAVVRSIDDVAGLIADWRTVA